MKVKELIDELAEEFGIKKEELIEEIDLPLEKELSEDEIQFIYDGYMIDSFN